MRSQPTAARSRCARVLLLSLLALLAVGAGPCEEAVRADVNLDGYVDGHDVYLALVCRFPGFASDPRCGRADVNEDGTVDVADAELVKSYHGTVLFDPAFSQFTPASVHMSPDGVMYLHAPAEERLYRWSMPQDRALLPIPLGAGAQHVTLSSDGAWLYVSYATGTIGRIDAGHPVSVEPFSSGSAGGS